MIISGRSEILDFGTYPVFSRKISASTTQSRESVFLIFSFLETEKISSHFISFLFSIFLIPFIPPQPHVFPNYLFSFLPFSSTTNIFSTSSTNISTSPPSTIFISTSPLTMASLDWPRETPHSPLYTKPLLFYFIASPS